LLVAALRKTRTLLSLACLARLPAPGHLPTTACSPLEASTLPSPHTTTMATIVKASPASVSGLHTGNGAAAAAPANGGLAAPVNDVDGKVSEAARRGREGRHMARARARPSERQAG